MFSLKTVTPDVPQAGRVSLLTQGHPTAEKTPADSAV